MNLIRRRRATLLYMNRSTVAAVQTRAGRGRAFPGDPERHLFPLTVHRVRVDRPSGQEGNVALLTGPTFTGPDAARLFAPDLFEELGRRA